MGRFTSAPVYTDKRSNLDNQQINQINSMLTAYYNTVRENGTQKYSQTGKSSISVSEYAGRVVDPVLKTDDKNIVHISFGLLLNGLQVGKEAFLLSLSNAQIKGYSYNGYSDETMSTPLPGYISIGDNEEVNFTLTQESSDFFQISLEVYL